MDGAMNKIPTLFIRDESNMSRVTRELTPGCEWVLAGEGAATRKWDGTNVRVTVEGGSLIKLEKRRNPTRDEKAAGAEPGYVDANRSDPSDKHMFAAVDATDLTAWPDGAWPCEAIGPKIQGGTDSSVPALIGFALPNFPRGLAIVGAEPRSFDELNEYLGRVEWEGIVFHHPDGRMAKIKRRDFGHRWPVKR